MAKKPNQKGSKYSWSKILLSEGNGATERALSSKCLTYIRFQ